MGGDIWLTPRLQLCLAHYCDTHGPTPLMVTEGLRNPCTICFEDPAASPRAAKSPGDVRPRSGAPTSAPQSQAPAGALNDALRDLNIARSASAPASEPDAQAQRAAFRRAAAAAAGSSSPLETPPDSPRPMFQQPRRDSSFRRTYDDTVTRKQGPCDNCAMTLPRRQGAGNDYVTDAQGPTLRTRTPIERVFGAGPASPPSSQSSSDTDGDREATRRIRSRRAAPASSRTTSCSSTSTSSGRSAHHFHYVSYTSTHEPILADSFSLVRASCLRALSFETLPRAPSTSTPTSSPQVNSPSFVTTQSPGSAATGGAIFFGDAMAGYTTAYIFRIPDLHARGHKRIYAFLALSTEKERLAMKTFSMISTHFRDMATWIQQLAEAEAERARESSPIGSVLNNGAVPQPAPSAFDPPAAAADRGGSSFLTGGSGFTRRMGGPGGASSLKARGLAELVGQPDFFIELHGRFVRLLLEAGVAMSS
ncbi:folliculin [Purpureocillium lilacinum]|uniref:Folliculin n=2 Tax=Purpureocillium lilacinum TaxID=33203 RepID=A0A179HS13_PURLI|nr:folliculin [Purpureocillium lilacinum]OAQ71602.1 folliculin [Purpureocillium lilacinum]OAQ92662.1 folliculin [Purpureocillium lilacinum]PWI72051.1 hypothetical protein PCL_10674 [Purpureocillium lilacinum]GJN71182.1 hypothetical protein PLICBS_005244 [Purpureocillium lilacinum]GJN82942.1 hypothetical protein PLIIFM63780_006488 [Purpureocillium lilacinum]